jgi:hypothetical protein
MEALKRRLLARVPALIGEAAARRGRRLLLCGLPGPTDVDGLLRLEGVVALLAALGLRPVLARPAAARIGRGASTDSGIWLGGSRLASGDLARLAPGAVLLLWPPEGVGAPAEDARASPETSARGHRIRVVAECGSGDHDLPAPEPLPDPMHALWGLLDHHPRGDGVLDLRTARGRGWATRLPPGRLALLRHTARLWRWTGFGGPLCRARRRLLESARRSVAAHAVVCTDRLGPSLVAALLARRVLVESAAVEAYWRRWLGDAAPPPPPQQHRLPEAPGAPFAALPRGVACT